MKTIENLTEKEYSKIIAQNLRRLMVEKGVEQKDVAEAIGVSKSLVSFWMNAARMPRMRKIDALCSYFGCRREDIMEPYGPRRKTKEITDDQAELIKITMKASPDNVALALALLRKLEGIN
jgi:transcriptional regulator with XRE-family HTH domain